MTKYEMVVVTCEDYTINSNNHLSVIFFVSVFLKCLLSSSSTRLLEFKCLKRIVLVVPFLKFPLVSSSIIVTFWKYFIITDEKFCDRYNLKTHHYFLKYSTELYSFWATYISSLFLKSIYVMWMLECWYTQQY